MFKIPDAETQAQLIEAYKVLAQDQSKVRCDATGQVRNPADEGLTTQDGRPYILSMTAGQAMADQRAQDWTVVAKMEFASLEDMRFYDDDCEAHKRVKGKAQNMGIVGGREGVLTVYYEVGARL
ncbi:stress responsive A/B barrel domain-containing protein [Xylariomycetidae sp. FL0641]|nr:stress responsive A/B barrel domain-containing protein [Xylariomycetidae sp. FL0641]